MGFRTQRARELRKSPTEAESKLWAHLRRREMHGLHFRRQAVIGPYYVDFLCNRIKLVIELDGGQHSEREAYDERRTRYLEARGFRVLRYWNHDVMLRFSLVLEDIAVNIASPQP